MIILIYSSIKFQKKQTLQIGKKIRETLIVILMNMILYLIMLLVKIMIQQDLHQNLNIEMAKSKRKKE